MSLTDFRCLQSFELVPERINVFVGRNNSGKSSVLEAVTIAASSSVGYRDALGQEILSRFAKRRNWKLQYFVRLGSNASIIRISPGHGTSSEEADVTLSYLADSRSEGLSDKAMETLRAHATEMARSSGLDDLLLERRMRSEYPGVDAPKSEMGREAARMMRRLLGQPKLLIACGGREEILLQKEQELLKSSPVITSWPETSNVLFTGVNYENDLKQLHDRLLPTARFATVMDTVKQGIDYLTDLRTLDDEIYVYQRKLERPIPISLMGDGFRDVLRILFISALTRNGIAIFEEPENSLHPGFLGLATEYLSRAALETNTQFFISTHSLEFLQYLLDKVADRMKIIRMSQTDNAISYEVLTGKEAMEESKEIGTDLRGV